MSCDQNPFKQLLILNTEGFDFSIRKCIKTHKIQNAHHILV